MSGFAIVAAISSAPGFSLGPDTQTPPGFALGAGTVPPQSGTLNTFLQWRWLGTNLGGPTIQVVDIIDTTGAIIATRGVGENRHVVTLRAVQLHNFLYYTSWLFPVDVFENFDIVSLVPLRGRIDYWGIEPLDLVSFIPTSGTLAAILHAYTLQLTEPLDIVSFLPTTGTLVVVLHSYVDQLTEPLDLVSFVPTTGTLVVVLVTYTLQLTEPLDLVSFVPISGTLV